MAAHNEIHFESYIAEKLVKESGWVEGHASKYDKERALYTEDVISWVKKSNPDAWEKLERNNGKDTERVVLDRLVKDLANNNNGTMKVLREGFNVAGAGGKILMSQKAPEDNRNAKESEKYKNNILRVVRQVQYNPTRKWSIDLVFFINGIPVATVEVKTVNTQGMEDAIEQYKKDRLPKFNGRPEPLLTFKRGAVVHFALTEDEIEMTTKLDGENTFFLPFNKGNNGRAGNVPRTDDYATAYFWEEVCQFDNWLRIFHNFVYIEESTKVDKFGIPQKKEVQIFPRYHQLEAVNKMIADAKENGAGMQYLCEHSAGSGKTSTIAWTAHDLTKLREESGKAIFNSVIIVTDRTVLDSQIQEAVQQIDHQFGMIAAIDKVKSNKPKSKQLAEALVNGTPIIIVTIQTFPFAIEAIVKEKSLAERNFAVIIDEAHSSQTGNTAQGLRAALSLKSKEDLAKMTVEELLLEMQSSRVQPKNISHFAFTATPKHSTMTLFGRPEKEDEPISKDNKPKSFHRYTQRQAIEEGFILDVLQNYTPYTTAYRLGSMIDLSDKRVDKKMARRALGRWKDLHPTNPSQKIEFIVKHFQSTVMDLLNGEAKAMVVTSGRPQAVKYKMAFDAYIKKHNLQGIKALVAFSGKVKGTELGDDDGTYLIDYDKEYTEYNMNPDIGSKDIRNAFEESDYKVMLVANKFQTGFNQPKLVAMYLDKKISGVEAVQTLSRLNRTYPGKDTTYVIDFANEPENILAAFKMYDEGAEMQDIQDIHVVYDMKSELDAENIYHSEDLEKFKQANIALFRKVQKGEHLHKKLYTATQRPTDVFNSKLKQVKEAIKHWEAAYDKALKAGDTQKQEETDAMRSQYVKEREGMMMFKSNLSKFVRTYNYVAQLIELSDPDLENFANFAKLFAKGLDGVSPEQVDLSGLVLTGYKINKVKDPQKPEEPDTLKPIDPSRPSGPPDREKEFLADLLKRMNELCGDIFSGEDEQLHYLKHIAMHVIKDPNVKEQLLKNSKEQALNGDLRKAITVAIAKSRKTYNSMSNLLLKDNHTKEGFDHVMYDYIWAALTNEESKIFQDLSQHK